MEASYSILYKESEYRILLSPVKTDILSDDVKALIVSKNIDVSELIIDRIKGESTTEQEVLHDITGWVADMFANNPNLIIYYSCDDILPIPSRNINSDNKALPVNEYRSKLFSHLFKTYLSTHQVIGVTDSPIRLDNYESGYGYSIYLHLIARDRHADVVELIKSEIREVSGK